MIEITYEPSKYELKMKGHANFKKHGEDIICSAASMLAYTLAQSVKSMLMGLVCSPNVMLNDGDAEISCIPKDKYRPNIDLIYWTVLNGFDLLSKNYPGYVSFIVIEDE